MNRTKRLIWTVAFLTLTGVPLGMECYAGFSKDKNAIPWTDYISHYIPWPIAALAYTILAVWLPFHFIKHYRQHVVNQMKVQARNEYLRGWKDAGGSVPRTTD